MLLADLSSATYTTSSPRLLSKYSAAADLVLRVFDLTMVVASGLIAYRIVFGTWVPAAPYRVAIATTLLYSVICFALFPLYRSWRGRGLLSELMVLGGAFGGVFALFAVHALIVQVGEQVSRGWIGLWFGRGLVSLVAARTLLRGFLNHLRTQGVDVQRVVVVGLRHPVMKISHYLSRNPWVGMNLVGYFRTPYDLAVTDQRQGLPCLGDPDELIEYLKNNQVEQVWISLPLWRARPHQAAAAASGSLPDQREAGARLFDFGLLNQSAEQIGSVPVINLRQGGVDRDNYFVVAKALQDKILAVIALMGLWPLMLAIAVGVKMSSPGPVFFRQRRHGLGGREFYMFKFRSMRVHDDHGTTIQQATKNDTRITRLGSFLRRSSLDELPQIFNVLGGSMSIVGPRPHAAQHNTHYEKLINHYMQRHYVKPGITGWAQVNGFRGETPELRTMKKRIQYDLDYIRRWSLWLDIRIIVLTAVRVLGQKTAY
uniref:GumD protein n=1 Tax=Xanthomonas campestris TaxID=339 RepID=Q56813_XANCA|nr:gumD [Xanthomonas campestris]